MRAKTLRASKGRWFYAIELFIDTLIVAFAYLAGFLLQRPYLFPDNLPDVIVAVLFLGAIALIVFLLLKTYRCGQRIYMQSMFDIIIAEFIIEVYNNGCGGEKDTGAVLALGDDERATRL